MTTKKLVVPARKLEGFPGVSYSFMIGLSNLGMGLMFCPLSLTLWISCCAIFCNEMHSLMNQSINNKNKYCTEQSSIQCWSCFANHG